jgi:hypothetical protein
VESKAKMASPRGKTIAKLRLTMPPIVSRKSVAASWAKLNQAPKPAMEL